jgi:colanic acid/amylovoran biosynthesis glycosyltransferase
MMEAGPQERTVLVFKETLLPLSETFIDGQTRALRGFVPRYIGLGTVMPSLPIPSDSILLTAGHSATAQVRQKIYRRIGLAPYFHRRAASARPHLVHAHFASGGRSALPLVDHLRVPLVVTLHGSDVTKRIDFEHRYSALWKKASIFLCVSEFIRRKAEDAGFPKEKLRVLYIGVDTEIFRPQLETRRSNIVLFVGRLVEKKGCITLLQAMAQVRTKAPNVQTVVIGNGPLRLSLEQLAISLRVPCQFLGAQPNSFVREWLSSALVLCAPSMSASDGDSEGLPTTIVEAQSMGIPVVSTYHSGIPEVVLNGRTGLLAPEADPQALADHILRFVEDDGRFRQACVYQGRQWIEQQFDLKIQTGKLEDIYRDVCESHARAQSSITKPLRSALPVWR